MLVIAHRGYHAKISENTPAAFAAAVALGVDGIETDVRICRDGSMVLIHDRVISGKAVVDLTHSELEQEIGYKVPTLDEMLERFPRIMWNVEIKTTEALELVIGVLEKHQTNCRILVTSFRHDVVAVCASILKVDCGLLVAHRPQTLNSMLVDCIGNARINHIVWDYNILDDILLKQAATAGYYNFVYGLVTKTEYDYCKEIDVDGVIVDELFLLENK
ncbi:MAG: glycerophosphodiester phosphodiesterase [Nitrosomonadaceae bacterium]